MDVPMIVPILLGVAIALPYIAFARSRPDQGRRAYATGLVIASAVYVASALTAGSWHDVAIELAGFATFSATAIQGARRWPAVLAAGWAVHVGWDLLLHPLESAGYAPAWYPPLCVGFDLFVAGFVSGSLIAPRRSAPSDAHN